MRLVSFDRGVLISWHTRLASYRQGCTDWLIWISCRTRFGYSRQRSHVFRIHVKSIAILYFTCKIKLYVIPIFYSVVCKINIGDRLTGFYVFPPAIKSVVNVKILKWFILISLSRSSMMSNSIENDNQRKIFEWQWTCTYHPVLLPKLGWSH